MSYVVSIVRDTPIDESEIRPLVRELPGFEIEFVDNILMLQWQNDSRSECESFVLLDGSLVMTSPSDEALKAVQMLADRLGATVVGEEGEDLTKAVVASASANGCGPFASSIALVAGLLAAYWFFN